MKFPDTTRAYREQIFKKCATTLLAKVGVEGEFNFSFLESEDTGCGMITNARASRSVCKYDWAVIDGGLATWSGKCGVAFVQVFITSRTDVQVDFTYAYAEIEDPPPPLVDIAFEFDDITVSPKDAFQGLE